VGESVVSRRCVHGVLWCNLHRAVVLKELHDAHGHAVQGLRDLSNRMPTFLRILQCGLEFGSTYTRVVRKCQFSLSLMDQ
jgi:hypothetical protein